MPLKNPVPLATLTFVVNFLIHGKQTGLMMYLSKYDKAKLLIWPWPLIHLWGFQVLTSGSLWKYIFCSYVYMYVCWGKWVFHCVSDSLGTFKKWVVFVLFLWEYFTSLVPPDPSSWEDWVPAKDKEAGVSQMDTGDGHTGEEDEGEGGGGKPEEASLHQSQREDLTCHQETGGHQVCTHEWENQELVHTVHVRTCMYIV